APSKNSEPCFEPSFLAETAAILDKRPGATRAGKGRNSSRRGSMIPLCLLAPVLGLRLFVVPADPQPQWSDMFARWSADGTRLVFMSDRDGDEEISLMNADGTDPRRLTRKPGRDAHPYFSRDGREILFQSPRANGKDTNIYVMNSDGSGVRPLTSLPGFTGVPVY